MTKVWRLSYICPNCTVVHKETGEWADVQNRMTQLAKLGVDTFGVIDDVKATLEELDASTNGAFFTFQEYRG